MTYEDQETVKSLWMFNVAGEVIKGNLQSTYYQGILDFMDGVVAPMTGIGNWGKAMPQPGEGGGFIDPRMIRYFNKLIISAGPHSSRVRALTQMIDPVKRVKELSEQEILTLRDALSEYILEGDLKRQVNQNIRRLHTIGCYRGNRHKLSMPLRGQRTSTNARTQRKIGNRVKRKK